MPSKGISDAKEENALQMEQEEIDGALEKNRRELTLLNDARLRTVLTGSLGDTRGTVPVGQSPASAEYTGSERCFGFETSLTKMRQVRMWPRSVGTFSDLERAFDSGFAPGAANVEGQEEKEEEEIFSKEE